MLCLMKLNLRMTLQKNLRWLEQWTLLVGLYAWLDSFFGWQGAPSVAQRLSKKGTKIANETMIGTRHYP